MNPHNGHYSLPWVEGRDTLQVYHSWLYKFKIQCRFENIWQFHECRRIAVTREESLGPSLQMQLSPPVSPVLFTCRASFRLSCSTTLPLPEFQESDLPKVSAVTDGCCVWGLSPSSRHDKKKKNISDEWTQERMRESWQPNIDKWKTKVKKTPGM